MIRRSFMGIQQILTGLGKAADPQKVLSTRNKKSSDEDVKKVDDVSLKDKIDLSEDGIKVDQMVKELERTRAGIKDEPQNAIKAQANVSNYNALEVVDETFGSVYAQLDLVKEQITSNNQLAFESQNNLGKKSVLDLITG
jgi:hypothetical protein